MTDRNKPYFVTSKNFRGDNKYIDINIATGTDEFKNLILNSSKELKTAITSLGLIISSFSLAYKPKKTPYNQIDSAFDFGFNKKA